MTNQQEIKDAFAEYARIKKEIRQSEVRLKELAPLITPYVPEDKEIQLETGYFYIQKRPKWTYSEATQRAEKDLKDWKKREEADGTAKNTPTNILYYRSGTPDQEKDPTD